MLKIGDFSRLTHVSIRMLRHYDEIGLLKPAHIDRETGYRYYNAAQLPQLNRILALQDLGFSLKQISHLLQSELSPEQLRGMILQKQGELEDRVRAEQERLARAKARVRQIESDDSRYDVIVKEVGAQWVASVRDRIRAHANIGYLFDRLFAGLAPSGINGLPVVIWHDDSHPEDDIDAEAMVYLPDEVATVPGVRVHQLPSATMATVVHHGAYQHLPAAYDALVRWLDATGYQIDGANRELYLHYSSPPRQDDDSYVTEIQFPVVRVND
jgi:DNA-binding transcriptional MerR regulator